MQFIFFFLTITKKLCFCEVSNNCWLKLADFQAKFDKNWDSFYIYKKKKKKNQGYLQWILGLNLETYIFLKASFFTHRCQAFSMLTVLTCSI